MVWSWQTTAFFSNNIMEQIFVLQSSITAVTAQNSFNSAAVMRVNFHNLLFFDRFARVYLLHLVPWAEKEGKKRKRFDLCTQIEIQPWKIACKQTTCWWTSWNMFKPLWIVFFCLFFFADSTVWLTVWSSNTHLCKQPTEGGFEERCLCRRTSTWQMLHWK